jgi:hypothetical protein
MVSLEHNQNSEKFRAPHHINVQSWSIQEQARNPLSYPIIRHLLFLARLFTITEPTRSLPPLPTHLPLRSLR